uniref:Uncharacterized protein n=1 Tax=Triticum urartu TaxID=4572 RepID=A0A8R7JUY9_TRIUA
IPYPSHQALAAHTQSQIAKPNHEPAPILASKHEASGAAPRVGRRCRPNSAAPHTWPRGKPVAVLRQVRRVHQVHPTAVQVPGCVADRMQLGLQELRQVHRRLPVRGQHHQLLRAPLHARRVIARRIISCCRLPE